MFNWLISFSLNNRAFILFAYFGILVFGTLNLKNISVDVFPDLNRPTVTLMAEAPGLAPEEVEQQVSFPVESAMNGLPGVSRVRSTSGIGLSIVYVEFDWGTDIYRNRQVVNERLGTILSQLPKGVVPALGPISSIMGEILLIGLTSIHDKTSLMDLRMIADWVIRPRLLSIPGVAQITPIGGDVKQYQVLPSLNKMLVLNVTLEDVLKSMDGFGQNTTGGYIEKEKSESLVRYLGQSSSLEDLSKTIVHYEEGKSLTLGQLAMVKFGANIKRGDASVDGKPSVILSVQKQPGASTINLTQEVEKALADIQKTLSKDVKADRILFKQANFIEHSIGNVKEALRDGAILVVIILFAFLMNFRTTFISLTAIPISLLITAMIFYSFGLSINTMTLGGLAIAIGELVDDAVVDVENIFRRLKENLQKEFPSPILDVIKEASIEVRGSIVYATAIVILVFLPLFALSGIEGKLFAPLGVAYIVSILASLVVSITLTPILSYYFLPKMKSFKEHGDGWLIRFLKEWDTKILKWSFQNAKIPIRVVVSLTLLSIASIPFLGKAFLPPFNEGTALVSLRLPAGASLAESNRVASLAEKIILEIPEVGGVGRRSGRAELDEHAEPVNVSEIDFDIKPSSRSRDEIFRDIRNRLRVLPDVYVSIGQPISHRLDHLLSGVRAELALKIFGENLDTLRSLAEEMHSSLQKVPGITDLQIEQQTLIPQLQIKPKREAALKYGVNINQLGETLETLFSGKVITQVLEGSKRFDLVIRLPEKDRNDLDKISNALIDSPAGKIPLRFVADIIENKGPNLINRDNSQRRIVVMANTKDRDLGSIAQEVQEKIQQMKLPPGYHIKFEGQFESQQHATRLIGILSLLAMSGIFALLYSYFRSVPLSLIIMANIPMALIGSVLAIWFTNQTLSVASLVGFITLTGIAARNGILKVSHYKHLMEYEGETFGIPMIIRGSLERLTPVLMTALVAAFALIPLLVGADQPGKEILHPVATVIFGGLISSTILDTILTPILYWKYGEK